MVDQRLQSQAARAAMLEAWKALDGHSKKNLLLGHMLREFQNAQDRDLSGVYSRLVGEVNGDPRKRQLLDAVEDKIRDDLVLYMLFPETHLVDYLIEEIERAAQADDGLQPGEQMPARSAEVRARRFGFAEPCQPAVVERNPPASRTRLQQRHAELHE